MARKRTIFDEGWLTRARLRRADVSWADEVMATVENVESTDEKGRYELAVLLWRLNEFYGSPDGLRLGSEHEALAAATASIRRGNLRVP